MLTSNADRSENTLSYIANAFLVVMLLGTFSPFAAHAQPETYPVKPVRIVAAFTAGGGDDAMVRTIAQPLSSALGQPVIVENRPGAGGLIGWQHVAQSAADGYTLTYGGVALAVTQVLRGAQALDVMRDFTQIARIGASAYVLTVHPAVPVKSVSELITLARARPGEITYASTGVGNLTHLSAALFNWMARIDMLHVPYKGAPSVYSDLLSGRVAVYFGSLTSAAPHVSSGKLRALGVTSTKRSRVMPDVPAIAESALPNYEVEGCPSLHGPAGLSRDIVNTINVAMHRVIGTPDVHERLLKIGVEPRTATPQEMTQLMRDAVERYGNLIRRTGIKAD